MDYVVAVVPDEDPEQLFRYALLSDPESVLGASGSAYYPVEVSGVLKEVLDKPGTCAIVGLPCVIKAIRLAARKNKRLEERIAVTVGLVCGQSKSKHFTEYLSALGGVKKPLQKVTFRKKSPQKPASNYFFTCIGSDSSQGQIFWKEGVSEAWGNRWFTPNACNYCDDVFAECADVTCMDAWLPEYSKDFKGTNLVLVRSALIEEILAEGIRSGDIHLKPIPVQRVLESQSGVIEEKRVNLGYRLYLDASAGKHTPGKRVKAGKIPGLFRKKTLVLKNQMQRASRTAWAEHDDVHRLENFKKRMHYFLVRISRWNRIAGYSELPAKCLHTIRGKVQGFFYA